DADEERVALPDVPELDGLAGARGVDLLVATGVDADVARGPDQVTRQGVRAGDDGAGVALVRRAAGQRDAELRVDVGGEARAVEAVGRGAAGDVRDTHVAGGDL